MVSMAAAVDTIACSGMDTQFQHAFTHGLGVAKVSCFEMVQAHGDAGLCKLIAHLSKPRAKWEDPILTLIVDNFEHASIVA